MVDALKNGKTFFWCGNGEGRVFEIAAHAVAIPFESTEHTQEMHVTIGHILFKLIEEGSGQNT